MPDREWLTTSEAAKCAGVTERAVVNWCVRFGIGRKIVGRWRVDRVALDVLLKGEPAELQAAA